MRKITCVLFSPEYFPNMGAWLVDYLQNLLIEICMQGRFLLNEFRKIACLCKKGQMCTDILWNVQKMFIKYVI